MHANAQQQMPAINNGFTFKMAPDKKIWIAYKTKIDE